MKDYLREFGFNEFTERHAKELSDMFEQNSVQYEILYGYFDLFGKVAPIGINWEKVMENVVVDDFKDIDDEKKKKQYERFKCMVMMSIIENIMDGNIALEYVDVLKKHFGKPFITHLLVYATLNVKNKGIEKRFNQLLDCLKKKSTVEANEMLVVNELNSELCKTVSQKLGIESETKFEVFNNNAA